MCIFECAGMWKRGDFFLRGKCVCVLLRRPRGWNVRMPCAAALFLATAVEEGINGFVERDYGWEKRDNEGLINSRETRKCVRPSAVRLAENLSNWDYSAWLCTIELGYVYFIDNEFLCYDILFIVFFSFLDRLYRVCYLKRDDTRQDEYMITSVLTARI